MTSTSVPNDGRATRQPGRSESTSSDGAGGFPTIRACKPTPRHAALLRGLLRDTGTAGNLTTDAHLAALALEHGADIISYDRDFERYPGINHRLPG